MLFTDIEGSTRLLHEIGDLYGDVLAEHDRLLRSVWSAHGGVVVHAEGDAFFVAFADVEAAVNAAAAAQLALDASRWAHGGRLRVRMGVHTGSPRVIGNDYWGVDVHYAARLCAAAHGGQVLLSASTASACRAFRSMISVSTVSRTSRSRGRCSISGWVAREPIGSRLPGRLLGFGRTFLRRQTA